MMMVMASDKKNDEENFISGLVKQTFHGISLSLLSLLLPLSFLLTARLTSLLHNCRLLSAVLYFLVFSLSFACLLVSITGRSPAVKAPKNIAWIALSLFQACISWGVGATVAAERVEDVGAGNVVLIKRAFLFVGIYEIMMLWRRMFVKPVVDDTVYGEERNEGGGDRVLMGVSFGVLWMWMLRLEVEPLVFSAGNERLGKKVAAGWDGFPLWLLSLTVSMTGVLRVVEVLFWPTMAILKNMGWLEKQDEECIVEHV